MAESTQTLSCLLLPVVDKFLLLPNVSIAEIVDYAKTEASTNGPKWLLGHIDWRGLRLPVVSYDALNGGASDAGALHEGDSAAPSNTKGRIAILNTIGATHDKRPFIAMVTQGIPRLAKVNSEMLQPIEGETGPADLMLVELEGQTAVIPNIEYIEAQLA